MLSSATPASRHSTLCLAPASSHDVGAGCANRSVGLPGHSRRLRIALTCKSDVNLQQRLVVGCCVILSQHTAGSTGPTCKRR